MGITCMGMRGKNSGTVASSQRAKKSVSQFFLRPFGAKSVVAFTHGLRRGLESCAASRLFSRQSDDFEFMVEL